MEISTGVAALTRISPTIRYPHTVLASADATSRTRLVLSASTPPLLQTPSQRICLAIMTATASPSGPLDSQLRRACHLTRSALPRTPDLTRARVGDDIDRDETLASHAHSPPCPRVRTRPNRVWRSSRRRSHHDSGFTRSHSSSSSGTRCHT